MQSEIEAKFLNINTEQLRTVLRDAGATCTQPMRTMSRKIYDFPDNRLGETYNGWVRVRNEGDKTTLSYKQLNDRTVEGTKEVSLTVDDFNAAAHFLDRIGLEQKSYQETKRESWVLDGVEIEIDEWPWVQPYVEIEAPDVASLQAVVSKLGYDYSQALFGSVEVVYQAEYDVTDAEVDAWDEITFSTVPDWLEAKRK